MLGTPTRIKGPRELLFVVFVAAVVTATTTAQSREKATQVRPTLELAITTNRHSYRLSDTIEIETRLFNPASFDVYVWKWDLCWNPARGVSMHVLDHKGAQVQSNVLSDCVPPPPRPGRVYDFIRLEPQSFYGHVNRCKVSDLVNKPGEYDLEVTFSSFLSDSFIQRYLREEPIAKLNVWTMENPVLRARPLHISVTQ